MLNGSMPPGTFFDIKGLQDREGSVNLLRAICSSLSASQHRAQVRRTRPGEPWKVVLQLQIKKNMGLRDVRAITVVWARKSSLLHVFARYSLAERVSGLALMRCKANVCDLLKVKRCVAAIRIHALHPLRARLVAKSIVVSTGSGHAFSGRTRSLPV